MQDLEHVLFSFLQQQLFLGPVLLLVIEEAGLPVPAEDVVFTYIGYEVKNGHISFWAGYLILLAAIALGSSFLYYLSSKYGQKLALGLSRYIYVKQEKLIKIETWFRKYGIFVIILGRHIPGFRVPITVFSGISELTYPVFLISVLVSDTFTIPFYMVFGMKFGSKVVRLLQQHHLVLIVLTLILACFLGFYLFLRKAEKKKNTDSKHDLK